jgi:hypothetical protein
MHRLRRMPPDGQLREMHVAMHRLRGMPPDG